MHSTRGDNDDAEKINDFDRGDDEFLSLLGVSEFWEEGHDLLDV